MNLHNSKFIEHTEYYIWWLLNCSQSVNVEQIKKEVATIITQLNGIYLETGDFLPELYVLEEIEMLGCDISVYQSLKDLENELEEEWREQYREEVREQYREEYREEFRNQYRQQQYA